MRTSVVLLLLAVAGGAAAALPTVLYVSPQGADASPGTRARPFATLQRAQAAVREKLADPAGGVVLVYLREGVHRLSAPLIFTAQDGGREAWRVVWSAARGEEVTLSGGRPVTGWQPHHGEVWAARVPWVAAEKLGFRQLWVNGRRAIRARQPDADSAVPFLETLEVRPGPGTQWGVLRLHPGTLLLPAFRLPAEVELVGLGNWAIMRKRLAAVDPAQSTVTLGEPALNEKAGTWNVPRIGGGVWLENAPELLNAPGEWYLDREAGVVYYWPRPGEDLTRAEVVAPVLQSLLEVRGSPEQPVRNLHFRGLRLAHSTWELPPGGYLGMQACVYQTPENGGMAYRRLPPAMSWEWAQGCSFTDGEIAHLGASGLRLAEGCRDCTVEGNLVADLSGNGLEVGIQGNTPEQGTYGNRLANNHVRDCGVEFFGAVAIWVGLAAETTVAHNLVHRMPYTGISVGWQWNPQPTYCRDNRVEYNHIYDVMNQLADGGGVYTLGFQPGTVLGYNLIHDVHRSAHAMGAPNNGFFIDEGSKGFLIEGNVIYATTGEPVRHNANQADWHTWVNNTLGHEAPLPGAGLQERYAGLAER